MSDDSYGSLLQRAEALVDLNRCEDALPLLARAIATEPSDAQPRCLLALALLRLGRNEEANEAARGALGASPDDEWAHRVHVASLIALDQPEKALVAAEAVVRLAPELAASHMLLAQAASTARRWNTAEEAALRARALAPTDVNSHITLSVVAMARRGWRQAEEHARAALAIDPENSAALNNLGVALSNQGLKREAVHYLAAASRLDPRDSTARHNALAAAGVTTVGVAVVVLFNGVRAVLLPTDEFPDWLLAVLVVGLAAWGYRDWRKRGGRRDDPQASKELMRKLRDEQLGRWAPSVLFSRLSDSVLMLLAAGVGFLLFGNVALVFDSDPTTTNGDRWFAAMVSPLLVWALWKTIAALRRRRADSGAG